MRGGSDIPLTQSHIGSGLLSNRQYKITSVQCRGHKGNNLISMCRLKEKKSKAY